MNRNLLFTVAIAGLSLAACDSGDINIQPQTSVVDSNNTTNQGGGNGNNDALCAAISIGSDTVRGSYDDATGNCTYRDLVGQTNNLETDLFIPRLPNGGAHIFEGSLFVGNTYDNDADLAAAGITQGGDGPTLTIEAGATLAWQSNSDFMIINRGSQIIARGTPDNPITFTSVSDVNSDAANPIDPEAVQQWGGIVINGFGATNGCSYVGTRGQPGFAVDTVAQPNGCHIEAEGSIGFDRSQYGGANDDDDSGVLEYVVVKHTGATVGTGNELNGISFGGVGRGTEVSNLQVYSTFDDGIEMFGGAFDITNLVAVYVRDDSIDIDEGYHGTITNALVVQSENLGNHCIESDGIGPYGDPGIDEDALIAQGMNSRVTINNLTCIISPSPAQGDFDPGAGWRFREGIFFNVNDSMVITSFGVNDGANTDDNYCLRIDNPETQAGATNGDSSLNSVIFACQETFRGTFDSDFAAAQGNVSSVVPSGTSQSATTNNDAQLVLLEGTEPVYSVDFANSLVDENGDGTGATPNASATPTSGAFLGALSLSETDWTRPWAYGIDPDNRGQALWFEGQ